MKIRRHTPGTGNRRGPTHVVRTQNTHTRSVGRTISWYRRARVGASARVRFTNDDDDVVVCSGPRRTDDGLRRQDRVTSYVSYEQATQRMRDRYSVQRRQTSREKKRGNASPLSYHMLLARRFLACGAPNSNLVFISFSPLFFFFQLTNRGTQSLHKNIFRIVFSFCIVLYYTTGIIL